MKNTKVRTIATAIAIPLTGWVGYQLASVLFTIYRIWEYGYTWIAFEPIAYFSAGVFALLAFSISWATRPKNTEPEDTRDPALVKQWEQMQKYGTPEEQQDWIQRHQNFFETRLINHSPTLIAERVEQTTPDASEHSLSPLSLRTTAPNAPPEQRAVRIITDTPIFAEKNAIRPKKPQNNGADKTRIDNAVEEFLINQIKSGNFKAQVKVQQTRGKFKIAEPFTIILDPSAGEEPAKQVNSKQAEKNPMLVGLPNEHKPDITPVRENGNRSKKP